MVRDAFSDIVALITVAKGAESRKILDSELYGRELVKRHVLYDSTLLPSMNICSPINHRVPWGDISLRVDKFGLMSVGKYVPDTDSMLVQKHLK